MRICILYNPRSGRGKAQRLTDAIERTATERSHEVRTHNIHDSGGVADETIADTDRLVIVGGDGTVHHMLPQLARTQTPFYHCGTGTANLICHAFRMSRSPSKLVELLEADRQPTRVDLPRCNGHPFLIMTSLGIDAAVIHRLEESRTLGGCRAYIKPVFQEVIRPRFTDAQVQIDNEPYDTLSGPGVLVIANMPNYGGNFNPCSTARWDDGKLDIAHIPSTMAVTAGLRYLALLARLPAAATARGTDIAVTATKPACVQIDGEKPTEVPSTLGVGQTLKFTMSDQSVRVHAPAL